VSSRYGRGFFEARRGGSRASAEVVVPIVLELVDVLSVVDVGCGTGSWLAAFRSRGADRVLGIDGDYVDRSTLEIPAESFVAHDLGQTLDLDERFDLAMSLEVAEHLPAAAAERLVATLTELAPVVLFSAAIPEQGGTGHVSERWQDEWAALFAARGFDPVDAIRPRVWNDDRVDEWYAQNTLLYVARAEAARFPRLRAEAALPLRVVHPRVHAAQSVEPGVRVAGGRFLRALRRSVARVTTPR
jgi:SAM-dependent methyltransferase